MRFNLPDSFSGNSHFSAHFFEGIGLTVQQPIAQLKNAHFTRWKGIQNVFEMLAQQIIRGGIIRGRGIFIFDKITQYRIFFVIGRCLQRKWAAGNLDHIFHFLRRNIQGGG